MEQSQTEFEDTLVTMDGCRNTETVLPLNWYICNFAALFEEPSMARVRRRSA